MLVQPTMFLHTSPSHSVAVPFLLFHLVVDELVLPEVLGDDLDSLLDRNLLGLDEDLGRLGLLVCREESRKVSRLNDL